MWTRRREALLKLWLDVSTVEYESLRRESLTSLDRQVQIVRAGVAALAILIATGQAKKGDYLLSGLLLGLVTPGVAFLVMAAWLAEVSRMVRAGAFIRSIERKVDSALRSAGWTGEHALAWESWLEEASGIRLTNFYRPVAFALFGFSIAGSVLGWLALSESTVDLPALAALESFDITFVGVTTIYYFREHRRIIALGKVDIARV